MVLSVKHVPCKGKDLNLDPQKPGKKARYSGGAHL